MQQVVNSNHFASFQQQQQFTTTTTPTGTLTLSKIIKIIYNTSGSSGNNNNNGSGSEIRRFHFVPSRINTLQQLQDKIRHLFGFSNDFKIILLFGVNKVISSDDSLLYLIESAIHDSSDLIFKLVDKEPQPPVVPSLVTPPTVVVVENSQLLPTTTTMEDFIHKIQTMTNHLNSNDRGMLLNKCLNYLDNELSNTKATIVVPPSNIDKQLLQETPEKAKGYGQKLAKFVGDVTIPDQTIIKPSTKFVKTWKFKNCGNKPLPKNSKLTFLKGNKKENYFNSPQFVDLSNEENQIKPGDEFVVSVELQTPESEGVFSSYFRMKDEDGVPFGQKVWVCVNVAK